jgi:alkanesulfonate monooxygenase SsuD/methylene tetrahydromethanopterin reductase-like flavin-dependent oxidoreductase (luciferase family)
MLTVAAQKADAVLIGSFVQGPGFDYALKTIQEAEADRDEDLGTLRKAVWIYFSVGPDAEAARRAATRGIALALRSSLSLLLDVGYQIPADIVEFIKNSRHTLNPDEVDWVVDRLPESLIEDLTLAGDAHHCVQKFQALARRGIDEVALLPFAPAGGNLRDTVDMLLADVAPATG